MPVVFIDNQWLSWCDDIAELQILKQLTPRRAGFEEIFYQPPTRRPTSTEAVSLLGTNSAPSW